MALCWVIFVLIISIPSVKNHLCATLIIHTFSAVTWLWFYSCAVSTFSAVFSIHKSICWASGVLFTWSWKVLPHLNRTTLCDPKFICSPVRGLAPVLETDCFVVKHPKFLISTLLSSSNATVSSSIIALTPWSALRIVKPWHFMANNLINSALVIFITP